MGTSALARTTWTSLSADDLLRDCRAVYARKGFCMPWGGILAVGGGAAVGAWLRWGLGIMLNPVFPTLPLGTLSANLIGGLLMGFAMEIITRHSVMSPEMQLLATTGFLGGLTTFSTFSAEIVTLLLRKEYL